MVTLLETIFVTIIGVVGFTLGIIVYTKAPLKKANQIFFVFTLCVIVWILSASFSEIPEDLKISLILSKVTYFGVLLAATFLFYFSFYFPKEIILKTGLKFFTGGVTFIFSLLTLFSNSVIKGVIPQPWGFDLDFGNMYSLFLIYCILLVIVAFRNFLKNLRISSHLEKLQLRYLFLGIIIFVAASIIVNVIVRAIVGSDIYYRFGNYSAIFLVIFTAFAILKYHLFEIRVILTEILVGAMGIVLFLLPFLMPSLNLKTLTFLVFLLFLIFGYYLIKATHEETKRREEAERLTVQERVLRDEAERIAIQERALRQRSEKLVREFERLDRAKTQFLLATQHHLRTPLSIMKNYASMLLEGTYGKLGEIVKHPLSGIYVSIERLIKVVNEFLDVAQLQLDKGVLKKAKTDMINYLKKEIIEELLPSAKEKGLYLKLEPSKEKIPEIMIDQTKMKTAIYNVVDNGLKYTQKGGVTIKLQIVNGKLQIVVKDTGIGIKKEEIAELFEKTFERGKEAEKLYTTGRGIGLYISKNFIEAHQGKIWAESEGEGKGSTFYIELPRT